MNKPQSWDSCDEDIRQFVLVIVDVLKNELGDKLVGVYLHGSLAMGGYYRPKSDIDLLAVVDSVIGAGPAKSLGIALAKTAETRTTTGNMELSIITAEAASLIPVPMPYELHYSSKWHDRLLKGQVAYDSTKTDTDLLSHLMYVRQRGVCLYGKLVPEVFGDYDWKYFMDAVIDDFNWILKDENIIETPYYGVLNICRVLQLLSEDNKTVHSKDEGGEWALKSLPAEYHAVIYKALGIYRSSDDVTEARRRTGGVEWDKEELLAFRDFARKT